MTPFISHDARVPRRVNFLVNLRAHSPLLQTHMPDFGNYYCFQTHAFFLMPINLFYRCGLPLNSTRKQASIHPRRTRASAVALARECLLLLMVGSATVPPLMDRICCEPIRKKSRTGMRCGTCRCTQKLLSRPLIRCKLKCRTCLLAHAHMYAWITHSRINRTKSLSFVFALAICNRMTFFCTVTQVADHIEMLTFSYKLTLFSLLYAILDRASKSVARRWKLW